MSELRNYENRSSALLGDLCALCENPISPEFSLLKGKISHKDHKGHKALKITGDAHLRPGKPI
jgi:hypothetical protein